MMIDALYNYRQGDIHTAEFSDEFNKLCMLRSHSIEKCLPLSTAVKCESLS